MMRNNLWIGIVVAAAAATLCVRAETTAAPDAKVVTAFQAECAAKAAAADKADSMTVAGKDGWLFLGSELRHLSVGKFWGENAAKVTRASNPEWGDPLPVILDFKEQLDKAGIKLILVPVPPKAVVYADKVGDAVSASTQAPVVPRLDASLQEFYQLLRDKGVTVLDLTKEFIEARANDKDDQRVYCKTDTHWSPAACELAAQRIAEKAGSFLGIPQRRNPFKVEASTITFTGDLGKALAGDAGAQESLLSHLVTSSGDDPKVTDTVDRSSPLLLLGDSHCLVFHVGGDMLATGAGLVDHLAFRLCIPVDLLAVRGSGATPARMSLMQRARGDAQYLAGKKVIVWCFTAREFTESQGWRKVPVVKSP